jgi:hypothetical protein
MSRFILVAILLAVTVLGCNRFPDNGLQIVANLPPDASCVLGNDQDTRLLRGQYDVSYRNAAGEPGDYVIAPLLASYLISNALEFQGEQNNLQVDNFDITVFLPDGTVPPLPEGLPNPYRVSTSAVLQANEAGSFTQEVAAAVGIPGTYQTALFEAAQAAGFASILLEIRAGGTTFGGFSQRSAPFRWPVDFCEGCLNDCFADADQLDNSCLPGQDIWLYCQP